jgi:hypothetical protein
MDRNEREEAGRKVVRRRIERKEGGGSEDD